MIRTPKSQFVRRLLYWLLSKIIFPRKFKAIKINGTLIKEGHSILILQNHISWWDGFWGCYLAYGILKRSFHVMIQEDQIAKKPWLRHMGGYSISRNNRSLIDSINYSSDLLNNAENMVLIFPQGRLQSLYARQIEVQQGVEKIISQVSGPCQVIYNAVTIDYLESFKPTVTFNLFDLGDAKELSPEAIKSRINEFHQGVLKRSVRE